MRLGRSSNNSRRRRRRRRHEDAVSRTVSDVYSRLIAARLNEWIVEDTWQCVCTLIHGQYFDPKWALNRLCFSIYCCVMLLLSVFTMVAHSTRRAQYWMIFLSNWSLLLTCIYFINVTVLHLYAFRLRIYKLTRILIPILCGINFVVVLGYWSIIFKDEVYYMLLLCNYTQYIDIMIRMHA